MNYEHRYLVVPPEQLSRAINKALKVLKELQQDSEHMGPFRADILSAFKALDNVKRGIVELPEPIAFRDLYRHLPFATSIQCGTTKLHIVNEGVRPVKTAHHTIERNEPLCGRTKWDEPLCRKTPDNLPELYQFSDCPGCLAKGRALAAKAAE